MRHVNIRLRVAGLLLLPLAMIGCSLPADDKVTPIDADGLPPELSQTTTTSTTTTVPTTNPPDTSIPSETLPPTSAPTTLPALTTPVTVFYTDETTGGMQGLRRLLLEPLTLQSVINQLESPPSDLASYGVKTSLAPNLIADTPLDRSVLTVSLNSVEFDPMSDEQKRQAIAQMVLTFTSFSVPGEGNIGSVIFQVDGVPIPVFIPADGTTRDPGVPVVYADFEILVVGTPGATPTTTGAPVASVPPSQTTAPPSGP